MKTGLTYKLAKQLGRAAFKAGKMRSPCRDKDFFEYREVGGELQFTRLCKEWLSGWDAENLKVDSKLIDN